MSTILADPGSPLFPGVEALMRPFVGAPLIHTTLLQPGTFFLSDFLCDDGLRTGIARIPSMQLSVFRG